MYAIYNVRYTGEKYRASYGAKMLEDIANIEFMSCFQVAISSLLEVLCQYYRKYVVLVVEEFGELSTSEASKPEPEPEYTHTVLRAALMKPKPAPLLRAEVQHQTRK